MKITVIGCGYVGLVSGVCLADVGHEILALDISQDVVTMLNQGNPHIHEIGLHDLLSKAISCNQFKAKLMTHEALMENDIFLIAVGTPSNQGKIDLTHIEAAISDVAEVIKLKETKCTVIVKSTVIPGTTDTFIKELLEKKSGKSASQFHLAMNPEFLREGNAVQDFMLPDRIILGCEGEETRSILEMIYRPWSCDKLFCNAREAEMIKYACNYLLALQISASNEMANLCVALGGIDAMSVIEGIALDKRWFPNKKLKPEILSYLTPGCGFGGSCFPKDVEAFRTLQGEVGLTPYMAQAILDVNAQQPKKIAMSLKKHLGELTGKKILLLGLAFKPGTDDIRESPALKIGYDLLEHGALLQAHDPIAMHHVSLKHPVFKDALVSDWKAAANLCEIIILATPWEEYRILSDLLEHEASSTKVLFDCRRMFEALKFKKTTYMGMGYSKKKVATCIS